MSNQKKNEDLAVLTKKKIVRLETEGIEEKLEIELYPFAWKHFSGAIELVTKYWDCYQKTKAEYTDLYNKIIEQTKEDKESSKRELLLEALDHQFNEIGSLVKNILDSNQDNLAEDVEKIIGYCLRTECNFESLNFGEIVCLLTAAIEVNMDFFDTNLKKSTLWKKQTRKIPQNPKKDGDLKLPA